MKKHIFAIVFLCVSGMASVVYGAQLADPYRLDNSYRGAYLKGLNDYGLLDQVKQAINLRNQFYSQFEGGKISLLKNEQERLTLNAILQLFGVKITRDRLAGQFDFARVLAVETVINFLINYFKDKPEALEEWLDSEPNARVLLRRLVLLLNFVDLVGQKRSISLSTKDHVALLPELPEDGRVLPKMELAHLPRVARNRINATLSLESPRGVQLRGSPRVQLDTPVAPIAPSAPAAPRPVSRYER